MIKHERFKQQLQHQLHWRKLIVLVLWSKLLLMWFQLKQFHHKAQLNCNHQLGMNPDPTTQNNHYHDHIHCKKRWIESNETAIVLKLSIANDTIESAVSDFIDRKLQLVHKIQDKESIDIDSLVLIDHCFNCC